MSDVTLLEAGGLTPGADPSKGTSGVQLDDAQTASALAAVAAAFQAAHNAATAAGGGMCVYSLRVYFCHTPTHVCCVRDFDSAPSKCRCLISWCWLRWPCQIRRADSLLLLRGAC